MKVFLLLPENVKLLLVGDLLEKHKELVLKLELNNRVTFLGNRTDVSSLIEK